MFGLVELYSLHSFDTHSTLSWMYFISYSGLSFESKTIVIVSSRCTGSAIEVDPSNDMTNMSNM